MYQNNIKKKKKKLANMNLNSNFDSVQTTLVSLFLIIAFYSYLRIYITSKASLIGASYIFSAFDFVAIFIVLFPYGIKHIIVKLLNHKIENQQYKNAKRVIYGAFLASVLYSLIIILIIFLLRNAICQEILINKGSLLCLLFLTPSILLCSICAVCKGFLQALNFDAHILVLELVEKIAMILGVIIFCNVFSDYGSKVANVIMNPEYKYAYAAAGSALGISLGLLLSTILNIIVYKLKCRVLKQKDFGKKSDDIYDIFSWLKANLFKFSAPFFFIVLYLAISQSFFFRQMDNQGASDILTYQWGSYSGISLSILLVPSMWVMFKTYTKKLSISFRIKDYDHNELKNIIRNIFVETLTFLIPYCVLIFITARYFIEGFLLTESDLAVRTVRLSSLSAIFVPILIMTINILHALAKPMNGMLNGIISLILGVSLLIILISILNLGLNGVIISSLLTSLIYLILNINSIRKILRIRFDILSAVLISIISTAIAGVVTFLIGLLLTTFLIPALVFLISICIFVLILFIAYCKLGLINEYSIQECLFGRFFLFLGKSIRLF